MIHFSAPVVAQAWFHLSSHSGLTKCPSGSQCPLCGPSNSLRGEPLFEQTDLPCSSPVISSDGRDAPTETEISEVQASESFREPLGTAFLNLSDQQGNSVDLSCNITHTAEPEGITPPSDLSASSSPLPLALSLSLHCPVERQGYENLWRILAYYSETAVRLEREIMLSKAPTLAYRYKQAAEAEGHYHTGVEASVRAKPDWLLQSAISIQLNRVQSNGNTVHLKYSSRVLAHPDPTTHSAQFSPGFHPWVLISTNHTTTALAAAARSKVELTCPLLSSGNPQIQWILPDGSRHISNKPGSRLRASTSGLLIQNVQLADAGIYHCLARVAGDVDILALRLAVEETSVPSSGEQVAAPVTCAVGEYAVLPCQASGSPEPRISWLLPDGNLVRRGVSVSGGIRMQTDGSLSLDNPSKRDAGYYRCIAVNRYGSDSLSTQLEIHLQQNALLQGSFPRGPQSAAGRSTKIRAPLLQTWDEGSGGGEEEGDPTGGRIHPRLRQPFPNRRLRPGLPRRRGPLRGPLRKIVPPTDQRRNHFPSRHRVTPNQKRIDPQKWADILAKIRQKTATVNSSQPVTEDDFRAEPLATEKPTQAEESAGDPEVKSSEADTVEAEAEGSSLDVPDLQEEDLQRMTHTHIELQTTSREKTETNTDSLKVTVAENPIDRNDNTQTYTVTGHGDSQTEVTVSTERQNKQVTSTSNPVRNGITSEQSEGEKNRESPVPTRTGPQRTRLLDLANVAPNSRPQRPWDSRRRIGQRRRITTRPRVRPLAKTPPRPDPTSQNPQVKRPETTTSQIDVQLLPSTVSPPAVLLTEDNQIRDRVAVNSLSPTVSDTTVTSSMPPSSISHWGKDQGTHPADIMEVTDSTFLTTPTHIQSHNTITAMRISTRGSATDTAGIQTHAVTQAALGKHTDISSSQQKEELERNLASEPYVTHSRTPAVFPQFSSAAPTAASTTSFAVTPPATDKMTEGTLTTTSGNTFGATDATVLTTSYKIIPTPTSKITAPRFTSTTATTSTTSAITTTSAPSPAFPNTTSAAYFKTASTESPEKRAPIHTNISAQTSPPTTKSATGSASTAATGTVPASTTLSREKPNVVDQRGMPVPGDANPSRLPTDWKNPGANSIPDPHNSRSRWSPTPLLPPVQAVRLIYVLFRFIFFILQ